MIQSETILTVSMYTVSSYKLAGVLCDDGVLAIAPVLWSQKSLLAVNTLFPLLTVYVVTSTSMRALSLQTDVASQRSISSERSMCHVVDASLSWVVTQVTGIEATTPGLGGSWSILEQNFVDVQKLRLKEEGENSSGLLNNSLEYIRSLAIQMWSLEWCMGPGASSCCEVDN